MEYVYVCHGDDFADLCSKSQQTVLRHDPDAELTVYTDKSYGLRGEIVVSYYHEFPFMLMNLMCQTAYLAQAGETYGQVVFMDVDAFMVQPLPDFEDDWDVGVTWRDGLGNLSMLMPYNYGIVLARHTIGAIGSWFWMSDRISRMSPKNQKWYGNQIALRELCGPVNLEDGVISRDHKYFNTRVKHLPCEQYNWTPEEEEEVGDRYFVHFKGDRKDLAEYYFDKCMVA